DDGNLLAHAGHTLRYDHARPHAVVTLEHQALEYDPAGQLAAVTGDGPLPAGAWRFDPHGRVQAFTAADGRRVDHVHAYPGRRAARREPGPAPCRRLRRATRGGPRRLGAEQPAPRGQAAHAPARAGGRVARIVLPVAPRSRRALDGSLKLRPQPAPSLALCP